VEQFSGKQFRCRHCNEIFFREKELDIHLRKTAAEFKGEIIQPHKFTPQFSSNVQSSVLYVYDIEDRMKKQWLKLKKSDVYDGL
jgi:hypothetical protein